MPRRIEVIVPFEGKRKWTINQNTSSILLFAKKILDKYSVLGIYGFDDAAMVFLMQLAGEKKQEQDIHNQIAFTVKLMMLRQNKNPVAKNIIQGNAAFQKNITNHVMVNLNRLLTVDRRVYSELNQIAHSEVKLREAYNSIKKLEDYKSKLVIQNKNQQTIQPKSLQSSIYQVFWRLFNQGQVKLSTQIFKETVARQQLTYHLNKLLELQTWKTNVQRHEFLHVMQHGTLEERREALEILKSAVMEVNQITEKKEQRHQYEKVYQELLLLDVDKKGQRVSSKERTAQLLKQIITEPHFLLEAMSKEVWVGIENQLWIGESKVGQRAGKNIESRFYVEQFMKNCNQMIHQNERIGRTVREQLISRQAKVKREQGILSQKEKVRHHILNQIESGKKEHLLVNKSQTADIRLTNQIEKSVKQQITSQTLNKLENPLAKQGEQVKKAYLGNNQLGKESRQFLNQVEKTVSNHVLNQVEKTVSNHVLNQVEKTVSHDVRNQIETKVSHDVRKQIEAKINQQKIDQIEQTVERQIAKQAEKVAHVNKKHEALSQPKKAGRQIFSPIEKSVKQQMTNNQTLQKLENSLAKQVSKEHVTLNQPQRAGSQMLKQVEKRVNQQITSETLQKFDRQMQKQGEQEKKDPVGNSQLEKVSRQLINQVGKSINQDVTNQIVQKIENPLAKQVSKEYVTLSQPQKAGSQVFNQVEKSVNQQITSQIEHKIENSLVNQISKEHVTLSQPQKAGSQMLKQVEKNVRHQLTSETLQKFERQMQKLGEQEKKEPIGKNQLGKVSRQLINQVGKNISQDVTNQIEQKIENPLAKHVNKEYVTLNQPQKAGSKIYNQIEKSVNQQITNQIEQNVDRQIAKQAGQDKIELVSLNPSSNKSSSLFHRIEKNVNHQVNTQLVQNVTNQFVKRGQNIADKYRKTSNHLYIQAGPENHVLKFQESELVVHKKMEERHLEVAKNHTQEKELVQLKEALKKQEIIQIQEKQTVNEIKKKLEKQDKLVEELVKKQNLQGNLASISGSISQQIKSELHIDRMRYGLD